MIRPIPFPGARSSDRFGNLIIPAESIIAHTRRIPECGEHLLFSFSEGGVSRARYQVVGVLPDKVALRFKPRTLAEVG